MSIKNLTVFVHERLRRHLNKGDIAIDATVGGGFDTVFLAEGVGEYGKVYGLDIQEEAIRRTQRVLKKNQLLERVELFVAGHQHMLNILPETLIGKVAIVMFNLGYLPNGDDRSIVTEASSTVDAIRASLKYIQKEGVISIVAYKGHSGGAEEFMAVKNFLKELDPKRYIQASMPTNKNGPEWLFLKAKS